MKLMLFFRCFLFSVFFTDCYCSLGATCVLIDVCFVLIIGKEE